MEAARRRWAPSRCKAAAWRPPPWGFSFTIYDGEGRVYTETSSTFQCPQEPGTYLVCEECYWGTSQENIGMEYYFWMEVTEEYLASIESSD